MSTTEKWLSNIAGKDPASVRDQILAAHAQLDKTRCIGWLRATGYRPKIEALTLAKSEQQLVRRVRPYPDEGCHVHPVEEGDV